MKLDPKHLRKKCLKSPQEGKVADSVQTFSTNKTFVTGRLGWLSKEGKAEGEGEGRRRGAKLKMDKNQDSQPKHQRAGGGRKSVKSKSSPMRLGYGEKLDQPSPRGY